MWIIISSILFVLIIIAIRWWANGPKTILNPDMAGKTIIVTGSNTGIGQVTALNLLQRGANVIFASRDEAKTQAVIDSIQDPKIKTRASFIKLDLGSFESINIFAEEFNKKYSMNCMKTRCPKHLYHFPTLLLSLFTVGS